jgi:hypothetical protein
MSDRQFFEDARNHTEAWERYVLAVNRLGVATGELTYAFQALAEARDALAQAILQDASVAS